MKIIAERKSVQIAATAFSYGSKHYFQLFKDDRGTFAKHLRILVDALCQGLAELHENYQTPSKKAKHPALTKREK